MTPGSTTTVLVIIVSYHWGISMPYELHILSVTRHMGQHKRREKISNVEESKE